MEALIVPRNQETEALVRRFSIALTELRAVKIQLETVTAERDALREEVTRMREQLREERQISQRLERQLDALTADSIINCERMRG